MTQMGCVAMTLDLHLHGCQVQTQTLLQDSAFHSPP